MQVKLNSTITYRFKVVACIYKNETRLHSITIYCIITKLRKHRPDIPVSTDIIVGFPGETEQDFQDTLDLVDTIGFDQSFSFINSPRPGTPASDLSVHFLRK